MRVVLLLSLPSVLAPSCVCAQTNVLPGQKWSWSESCGWMNWRDADGGSQGANIGAEILSGYVWGANFGWVHLGDGSPAGGTQYSNSTGEDHGVNISPLGDLFGFAWGESVGWINFDTRDSLSPSGQQARIDSSVGRLRGFAWASNIGWINLDSEEHFVGFGPACYPDCDENGVLEVFDLLCFTDAFTSGSLYADCDGSAGLDFFDFLCFQNQFAGGCP